MLRIFLAVLTSRITPIRSNFKWILIFLEKFYLNLRGSLPWSQSERNAILNSVRRTKNGFRIRKISQITNDDVTLFIPATIKDFDILKEVIRYATRSLAQFNNIETLIVVPNSELKQVRKLLEGLSVKVLNEEDLFSKTLVAERFPNSTRINWIYQQFLKLSAIYNAETSYVLVLDADTILLTKREWVDKNGRQILSPTLEFEKPYDEIASQMNLALKPDLSTSFVPHHMLYWKNSFKSMLQFLNVESIQELADLISKKSQGGNIPFCVDYELYGRFLLIFMPEKLILTRWANLPLKRKYFKTIQKNHYLVKLLSLFFNSISFHSWTSSKSE